MTRPSLPHVLPLARRIEREGACRIEQMRLSHDDGAEPAPEQMSRLARAGLDGTAMPPMGAGQPEAGGIGGRQNQRDVIGQQASGISPR